MKRFVRTDPVQFLPGKFFVLSAVLFCSSLLWALDDPRPGDFAGAMVYSGREGSLLLLEIPMEAYRGFRRPDLGDLRIFDASGQSVPFIIRDRPEEMFTPRPEDVPFFIWDGRAKNNGTENTLPGNTDIEINTSGGIVRIKNQGGGSGKSRTYLADLSLLNHVPSTLAVKIDSGGKNFNTPVSIHYSGDLSNWREFDKRQTLASFGGTFQDTLKLPEPAAGDIGSMRYLLINFAGNAPPPLGMSAGFTPREKPVKYHEVFIPGTKSFDEKKVNYNTEAFYPAESIDFVLAWADSIPVLIKERFSEDDEWNIRGRETLYRYNSARGAVTRTAKNPPFEISSAAPLWELETSGGLLFSSAPEMVIRWKARELIFPARGAGPWTLAYGNAACGPLGPRVSLPAVQDEELEPARFTGVLRSEKTALPVPAGENKYRVYILWAFLGASAIVLSILAFSIAKSMRK